MNSLKDILSGVSVALVLIPGSMAYADLAGLPPEYGWISAIVAPIAKLAVAVQQQSVPFISPCLLIVGEVLKLADSRKSYS